MIRNSHIFIRLTCFPPLSFHGQWLIVGGCQKGELFPGFLGLSKVAKVEGMMLLHLDTCPVLYAEGVLYKTSTSRVDLLRNFKGGDGSGKIIEYG